MFDVFFDFRKGLGELLAFDLHGNDIQASQEGNAGIEHRCQLAAKKQQVIDLDFFVGIFGFWACLAFLFFDGRRKRLDVDDKIREALVKQPKLEVLRKIARAAGHRGLQEEGILLVAQGITSLNELQRVLK